ncbi:MAG: DUF3224 domain-containing protein [Pseudomonadota bacterium]
MTLQCTYDVTGWNEHSLIELAAPNKFSRAEVKRQHSGRLVGAETLTYTLAYRDEHTSVFVGMGVLTGSFDGRDGTYCVMERGQFENGIVTAEMAVHRLNGDDKLSEPLATGSYTASMGESVSYTLD